MLFWEIIFKKSAVDIKFSKFIKTIIFFNFLLDKINLKCICVDFDEKKSDLFSLMRIFTKFEGEKVMLCHNSAEHYGYRLLMMDSIKRFLPKIFLDELDDSFEKIDYKEPIMLKSILETKIKCIFSSLLIIYELV